uniref:Small ribosomal subunit protein uS3c n=1 Tax=Polysiphonia elongata TaxID=159753 RepID=A0A1Z1MBX0_9FLOR|nr:ribosomal protein S3 [Polysiphonia elongata]ARW63362.1 ribosomal protein S3 [Polysiphonia elongata]
MGQKIHPSGFRLGITESHRSSWFSKMQGYPKIIEEDYKIRDYIENKLDKAGIAKININRKLDQTEINIHTARPGIILGKSGAGIELIRKNITQKLKISNKIRLNLIEVTEPDREAKLLSQWIAQQLEKRVAFRRVLRQGIQKAQKANITGIKIQISGRLNGAEIARKEWAREGRVPLQTLKANIDYAYSRANTIYGILGIKIWLFKSIETKTS